MPRITCTAAPVGSEQSRAASQRKAEIGRLTDPTSENDVDVQELAEGAKAEEAGAGAEFAAVSAADSMAKKAAKKAGKKVVGVRK